MSYQNGGLTFEIWRIVIFSGQSSFALIFELQMIMCLEIAWPRLLFELPTASDQTWWIISFDVGCNLEQRLLKASGSVGNINSENNYMCSASWTSSSIL